MIHISDSPELISLYFHIPFCTRKCDYCHFYVLPDKDPFKLQLLEGLRLEWLKNLPLLQDKQIASIYFGGGTPSLFGPEAIGKVLSWISSSVPLAGNIEITLEANPENITLELMRQYASVGINRVSIGVQTFDEQLLKTLGRLHSDTKAKQAITLTAEAGIKNISIDLMYDLPGQSLTHWQSTLNQAVSLPISHLSLYNLTIEPHTVFFKIRDKIAKKLPDEETSLAMYETAVDTLQSHGLMQYEISAFCSSGAQSKHNVGYWTARPFLGFGPSAFSYWAGSRFRNVANLSKYHRALMEGLSPVDFEEKLDVDAHLRELLTIRVRLTEGVDLENFQAEHGKLGQDVLLTVERLVRESFLDKSGSRVRLTRKGILFYDTVAAELV